jgi:hypothetical protein
MQYETLVQSNHVFNSTANAQSSSQKVTVVLARHTALQGNLVNYRDKRFEM